MMADSAADFGEAAATEEQVADWLTLVRAGRAASHGYRPRAAEQIDRMRPVYGSGRASSEGEE